MAFDDIYDRAVPFINPMKNSSGAFIHKEVAILRARYNKFVAGSEVIDCSRTSKSQPAVVRQSHTVLDCPHV